VNAGGASGSDTLFGGPGRDLLDGGSGSDFIFGDANCDRLVGGDDNDFLDGEGGSDIMIGGAGIDTANYAWRSAPVNVTLDASVSFSNCTALVGNDGEAGEGDNVDVDVEHVWGGSGNDQLTGNAQANALVGGGGDDKLDGGLGPDVLIGDDGFDTVDYSTRTQSVLVTLSGGNDDGEYGERDDISSSEGLRGGSNVDIFFGTGDRNEFHGGDGDDRLWGEGGPDTLFGDGGNDWLHVENDTVDDTVQCGSGPEDRVFADQVLVQYPRPFGAAPAPSDAVAADCETIIWTFVSPPPLLTVRP
jgi:Ca2+-binding RTX toxin-like protein